MACINIGLNAALTIDNMAVMAKVMNKRERAECGVAFSDNLPADCPLADKRIPFLVTKYQTPFECRPMMCGYVLLDDELYNLLGMGYDYILPGDAECTYEETIDGMHVLGWDYMHCYNEHLPVEGCILDSIKVASAIMDEIVKNYLKG